MKRAALIGAGTLGGLGAVLSITPPQFGNGTGHLGASGASAIPAQSATPAPAATSTAPQTQTASAAPTTTKKKKTTATKKATTATQAPATSTATPTPTPTPTPTKAASTGYTGVVVGNTAQTRWGPVQVELTISNGKITAAKALQYPNGDGRSASISSQAIPYLVQQTLAAQSANIQGVGGASYTSYGWYQSLMSALSKAGMK
jgi:uncharacterized protein with FMN-binding domain